MSSPPAHAAQATLRIVLLGRGACGRANWKLIVDRLAKQTFDGALQLRDLTRPSSRPFRSRAH